jgi:S1-C subfamily serine protease
MSRSKRSLAAIVMVLALASEAAARPAAATQPASEAGMVGTARATLARYGQAIVTVRVVLKRRYIAQGRERGSSEAQIEVAGTVLTPGGLTVVSDATTNPSVLSGAGDSENRLDSEVTDVKLVLRDGREIAARFVLRDQDLDLAFAVPEQAGLELPYVDLKAQAAPVPGALDDLIYLYPLGRSLGREVAVALDRVRAVARKPRTFVASEILVGMQSLGCPVFDAAGRVVGLSVLRRAPRSTASAGGFRDIFDAFAPVVLMSSDLLDVAGQALRHAATPTPTPTPSATPAPQP